MESREACLSSPSLILLFCFVLVNCQRGKRGGIELLRACSFQTQPEEKKRRRQKSKLCTRVDGMEPFPHPVMTTLFYLPVQHAALDPAQRLAASLGPPRRNMFNHPPSFGCLSHPLCRSHYPHRRLRRCPSYCCCLTVSPAAWPRLRSYRARRPAHPTRRRTRGRFA